MSTRHHPSDDLLLAYAAGTLAEGWSLTVATHLSLCPECRSREAMFNALGGAALEDCSAEALGPDALAECIARAERAADDERGEQARDPSLHNGPQRDLSSSVEAVLPEPLRTYVGGDLDSVRWWPLGGGIRQHRFKVQGRERARLLYIPANTAVPTHRHGGLELTLVLAGSFADETVEFRRGDLEITDETVEHTPVAGPETACICLAVTDAPVAFRQWLPRLIQPFSRI